MILLLLYIYTETKQLSEASPQNTTQTDVADEKHFESEGSGMLLHAL